MTMSEIFGLSYIVTGQVDTNAEGTEHLSMPIGPFDDAMEAVQYMASLAPLWGIWEVVPLWSPRVDDDVDG